MSKRLGNFQDGQTKKQKCDTEDPWGDDIDIDALDSYIELVENLTQDKNKLNCTNLGIVSQLPSYTAFKTQNAKPFATSTQSGPSTSGVRFSRNHSTPPENRKRDKPNETAEELQTKIHKLQETLRSKEGEVSILRSQMKQARSHFDSEREKRETEWKEKLDVSQKELRMIQSELDFKNLEITNLKQKITSVTKLAQQEGLLPPSQIPLQKPKVQLNKEVGSNEVPKDPVPHKVEKLPPLVTNLVIETWYPLRNVIPSSIFILPEPERHHIRYKDSEYIDSSKLLPTECDLREIFPEIETVIQLGEDCLKCKSNTSIVCKILCRSIHLIQNFSILLDELLKRILPDDLTKADMEYLNITSLTQYEREMIFSGRKMYTDEMCVSARQSVAFVSEVSLYCPHVMEYIVHNRGVVRETSNQNNDNAISDLKAVKYLDLLLSCVTNIGKLRNSPRCVGFLCAETRLLTNMAVADPASCLSDVYFNLFKETVFARPTVEVLVELSYFLRSVSHEVLLVNKFCTMNPQGTVKRNDNEGMMNYDSDSCVFHVLSILCQNNLSLMNSKHWVVTFENFICFFCNALSENVKWLTYTGTKLCNCLYEFSYLSVQIVTRFLYVYKNERNDSKPVYSSLFIFSAKLLELLSSRLCTFVEKYLTLHTAYQNAVSMILDLKDELPLKETEINQLKQLLTVEEETIDSKLYSQCSLWCDV